MTTTDEQRDELLLVTAAALRDLPVAAWDRAAVVRALLDAVPDGWVKVDGRWEHVADEHVVVIEYPDWHIEHSLTCRLSDAGMSGCVIHEEFTMEAQREYLAGAPARRDGRYRARLVWPPFPEPDDVAVLDLEPLDVDVDELPLR